MDNFLGLLGISGVGAIGAIGWIKILLPFLYKFARPIIKKSKIKRDGVEKASVYLPRLFADGFLKSRRFTREFAGEEFTKDYTNEILGSLDSITYALEYAAKNDETPTIETMLLFNLKQGKK